MPSPLSTSSGDPIADKRFAIATALAGSGDVAAAVEVLAQALERAPGWAAGWLKLGDWRERLGDRDGAAAAYRQARTLDPADALGAGLRLAVLSGASPEAMPAAYVRTLFDDYAPRFEAALTERLGYRTPAIIAEALRRRTDRPFAAAIDLGCGTGLMGAAIRDRVATLAGVDLSEKMLKVAATKGVYDRLAAMDALAFLDGEPEARADLILAADVVPYFGDLAALFRSVVRVLGAGGIFAFSAERHDGDGFVLGEKLRYRHAAGLIADEAEAAGVAVVAAEPATLRMEAGRPVAGLTCIAMRAG